MNRVLPASVKPSICFLIDYMIVGGVEKVVCDAVDYLHDKFDITIFTFSGVAPEIRERLGAKAEILVHPVSAKKQKLMAIPFLGGALIRHTVRKHYDFMIVLRSRLIMASQSKSADSIIFWNHSDKDMMYAEPHKLGLFRKVNWLRLMTAYRKYDAIWVINDLIRDKIQTAFKPKRVVTLENPINCQDIRQKSMAPADRELFLQDGLNFVVVSRLSAEKAVDRTIIAMSEIARTVHCKLIIVGDGPARKTLEEYVVSHGLEGNVSFVGTKANPYPYMKQADLVILPSKTESFGLVILEAMMLHTPILASDTVGSRFLLNNGEYGILTENSAEGILSGMKRFIECPNTYRENTYAAYSYAQTFDIKAFTKKLTRLLDKTHPVEDEN